MKANTTEKRKKLLKGSKRREATIKGKLRKAEEEAQAAAAAPSHTHCDVCKNHVRTLYELKRSLRCINCVPWNTPSWQLVESARSGSQEIWNARQRISRGFLGTGNSPA